MAKKKDWIKITDDGGNGMPGIMFETRKPRKKKSKKSKK